MSELTPEHSEVPDDREWTVLREHVTQEMLNETGFGKTLQEQYDEQYGPGNWKWEADVVSVLDQTRVELDKGEHRMATEALLNSVAFGENKTNDGVDATGLRAMAATPVFGKVFIVKDGEPGEE